jgi:phosphocarrier protein
MLEKKITIKNRLGLHARAAAKFVNLANRYSSSVKIIKDGNEVDGKSILGILTLAASKGTQIKLVVSGRDENQAMEALYELINGKFGEEN